MSKNRRHRQRSKKRQGALSRATEATLPKPISETTAEASVPGGQGGDTSVTRSELKMEEIALKQPHLYGLNQKKREDIADRNVKIITDPDMDVRMVVAATRNVLVMQAQQNDLEKRTDPLPATSVNVNVSASLQVDISQLPLEELKALRDFRNRIVGLPQVADQSN